MPNCRKIFTFALLLTLVGASSTLAYTIYFKDGTKVIAKQPYVIEDGKAIIVLRNGTTASYPASQIDTDRTSSANLGTHGSALVLENGKFTEVKPTEEAPRRRTLTDAIQSGEAKLRNRPEVRRQQREAEGGDTRARGYIGAERKPYRNQEVTEEIRQQFQVQGIGEIQVFQGTQPDRVLFDVTTNSEASVFLGLEIAAKTLLRLEELYPDQVDSFEILMRTERGQLGGQFELTRGLAAELAEGSAETSAFFIEQVIF